jgi:hypothetical protein
MLFYDLVLEMFGKNFIIDQPAIQIIFYESQNFLHHAFAKIFGIGNQRAAELSILQRLVQVDFRYRQFKAADNFFLHRLHHPAFIFKRSGIGNLKNNLEHRNYHVCFALSIQDIFIIVEVYFRM